MIKRLTIGSLMLMFVHTVAMSAGSERAKSVGTPVVERLKLVSHVYPPFSYKSNGIAEGALVRVMALICAEAKISCTTEMHSFQESMNLIASGDADVIFTLTVNEDPEDRNEKLLYASTPLTQSSYAFFVPYDSTWEWTGNSEDLNGFTLYAFGPSATSKVAEEAKPKSLVLSSSNVMAFQNMLLAPKGAKVAMVVNKDVGDFMLNYGSVRGPKYAGSFKNSYIGFGFSRKSKKLHLYPPLIKATNKLLADKTIARILTSNKPPLLPVK